MFCKARHCNAMRSGVVRCEAVRCGELLESAAQLDTELCNAEQSSAVRRQAVQHGCSSVRRVSLQCGKLLFSAVWGSVRLHGA
eukprot:3317500-Alexandrium_andersonii.AAC.1